MFKCLKKQVLIHFCLIQRHIHCHFILLSAQFGPTIQYGFQACLPHSLDIGNRELGIVDEKTFTLGSTTLAAFKGFAGEFFNQKLILRE